MNFHAVVKSTFTLIVIAVLFAGISAFAAPDIAADDEDLTLTGIVMDAESHEPISGVVVGIIGYQDIAETDSEGVFSFSDVSEGEHTLVFQADEYEYTELEIEVTEDNTAIEVFLYEAEN